MFGLFRRSRRLLLIPVIPVIGVVALLSLMMSAGPAAADSLVGASPGSGTRLRSSPDSVDLTFDAPVMLGSGSITVVGPNGSADSGAERTRFMTVSQPLRGNLPDGTYTVSWSARFFMAGDRSGNYAFTIRRAASSATPTPATSPTPKVKATPRTVVTRTPAPTPRATATPAAVTTTDDLALSLAASEPGTTATVPAPAVKSVSATGSGHLPSPIVLWGLILVLCVVAVLISRLRTSRIPPPPVSRRVSRQAAPGPTGLGSTAELPALAAPVAPSLNSSSSSSSSTSSSTSASSSTTATLTAPIGPVPQHSGTTSSTGSMRRADLRRAESRRAESRRTGGHQQADDADITEKFPGLLPYDPD